MLHPKINSIFHHKCPRCLQGDLYLNPNSYNLKETANMHRYCSHCNLDFIPEPGYYYGAMYVSYAFTVAIGVAIFVAQYVLFSNIDIMSYLITLSIVLLLLSPYTFRTSRSIWLNLFVHYDAEKYGKK